MSAIFAKFAIILACINLMNCVCGLFGGAKIINFAFKTRNFVSEQHKNEEFCIEMTQNEDFCIYNDEFCSAECHGRQVQS